MKVMFFALILTLPFLGFSQTELKPGFVVKSKGDTLRGFLEQTESKKIKDKIAFAPNASAATITFTTKDVSGFGYDGENAFQKVTYTNTYDLSQNERFAKALIIGYYNLYTFWDKDTKYFIIKNPQDSCYFLTDDDRHANGYLNEKGNFQNALLFLSLSCGDLKTTLERKSTTASRILLLMLVSLINV